MSDDAETRSGLYASRAPAVFPAAGQQGRADAAAGIEHRLQCRVEEVLARAAVVFGRAFRRPTISYALRGKTAGVAVLRQGRVKLNPVLLAENVEEFVAQVLPHEMAHLFIFELYGTRVAAHGKEWKALMRALGCRPETRHTMDVSNSAVAQRRYRYACRCRILDLSAQRHAKLRRGDYACSACRARMHFTGVQTRYRAGRLIEGPPLLPQTPPQARPTARNERRPSSPAHAPTPLQGFARAVGFASRPPASSGATPPSEAVLALALRLCEQLGMPPPPAAALANRMVLATLIDQMADSIQRGARVPFLSVPRQPVRPPQAGQPEHPTQRQLGYARDLARRRGVSIDPPVLASKQALSRWISEHCGS